MDSMVVDSSLDQDVDIDSDPAPFAAEMDPDDLDLNQSSRRKGKNKKRAFDDMTWKGYVSVEDLQAQKQATQPPKGWRPVLSEEQERYQRFLERQALELAVPSSTTAPIHPGSARTAGYGSQFYPTSSNSGYPSQNPSPGL